MSVFRRLTDFISRYFHSNKPATEWFCIAFTGSRAGLNLQMFDVLSGSNEVPGVVYALCNTIEFRILKKANKRLLIVHFSFPGLEMTLFEAIAKHSDLTFLLIETAEFPFKYKELCGIAGSSLLDLDTEALFRSIAAGVDLGPKTPQRLEIAKLAAVIRRQLPSRCGIELDDSWSLVRSLDQSCPYFRFLESKGLNPGIGSDDLSRSLLQFMPWWLRNKIEIVVSRAR